MANQEKIETDSIVSFVKRAAKLADDSTTLLEQFTCFLCCYVLFPHFALSIWFAYFELTVVCTFYLDELNVSRDGWKEKCSFKKFGIMIRCLIVDVLGYETGDLFDNLRDIVNRKAPCLLGLYDLVVAPAGSEAVNEFQDAAAELADEKSSVENSDEDSDEESSKLEKQPELLTLISTACNLKSLLNESKGLETELRAQNATLYEKLCESEVKCIRLHNSLIESFESNQELKDQVDELMEDNSMSIKKIEEQHKLQIFDLNKFIEALKLQSKRLVMLCTTEARNAEHFRALSSEYEEKNKIMETNLKKTIQELESDKDDILAKLSIEASYSEHFRALSSEYEEKNKIMETNLKKTIQELESEKDDILARLSIEASNAEHFRVLSSKTAEELKTEERNHKATSDFLTQFVEENDELNETISELEHEKDELSAKLADALSEINHFKTVSSEYKDANESLEQEKGMLLVSLQKANESAEFHKKLLDLEYAIV